MLDEKICDWLMDNADAPIRYRVARELLKDEKAAKKIESELFEHKEVQKWLANLKPHDPPQHWNMEHGCFDFNIENAMSKCVHLGLHGDMPQMRDAVGFYINKKMKNAYATKPCRFQFNENMTANYLSLANIKEDDTLKFMLESLDEMYAFAKQNRYNIYLTSEERARLTGVPKNWRNCEHFIYYELIHEYGFCFPLIYDMVGLHRLYDLKNPDIDMKINTVLNYISGDDFHTKISGGYGILVAGHYESGTPKYNGMGWDPKYPGWFDAVKYMENGYVPKLLYFAQFIIKYPIALKTKWFNDLINYLEKYKTENERYIFPKEWLPEKPGYAVGGFHMSFGENKRKKNWLEIESTFYMQLLKQNI
jgi:hypothetical protein